MANGTWQTCFPVDLITASALTDCMNQQRGERGKREERKREKERERQEEKEEDQSNESCQPQKKKEGGGGELTACMKHQEEF